MSEHPILFSGEMVRAILAGNKTQTRRLMKPHPVNHGSIYETSNTTPEGWQTTGHSGLWLCEAASGADDCRWRCLYGIPGDHLWVRESAYIAPPDFGHAADANRFDLQGRPRIVGYAASMDGDSKRCAEEFGVRKSPSIHMPRWASRLTLEVAGVRVERLHDISENDAICEGMLFLGGGANNLDEAPWADPGDPKQYPWRWARGAFCAAWKRINEKRMPWGSNPWVWVIQFKVVKP